MHLVTATFVRNEVEPGWLMLRDEVPLGQCFQVDLDRIESGWISLEGTDRRVPMDWIYVVAPGPPGWLPLLAPKVQADA